MTTKTHRLKYDHDDGRAGTLCGIELRNDGNGYRSKTTNTLRRVPVQFDMPVKIVAAGEETCSRCQISGPNRVALRRHRH